MKKNLMTYAAGRMLLTILFCCAMTTVVSAQTAETESSLEKYLRLSKEADETTSRVPPNTMSASTSRSLASTRRCPTLSSSNRLSC